MLMEVNFFNQVKASCSKKIFSEVIKKSFKKIKYKNKGEISIVLTDQKTIKRLNRIYRHSDKVTNILSFVFSEAKDFIKPKTKNYLGEIFICYPEAVKGAQENKRSIKKELERLTIHGLLHLLGYTHKNKKQRDLMEGLEEELIKAVS